MEIIGPIVMFLLRDQKRSKWVLAVALLLTGLTLWRSAQIEFNYDFSRFFPPEDAVTIAYERFKADFGSEENYLLVGLPASSGIFNEAFLGKVNNLTQRLESLPDILSVSSPTNLQYLLLDPLMGIPSRQALLSLNKPENLQADSVRVFESAELVGTYFSSDRKAVSLLLVHTPGASDSICSALNDGIYQVLEELAMSEAVVAGRCSGQTYYVRLMRQELVVFLSISLVLIFLFLGLAFRSAWGIWVPLAIVGLAVLFVVGLMESVGKPLDIISNVIPSVLLVVCLSAVVHILSKYMDELRTGTPRREALIRSLRMVGRANLLTTLTTAIGFLTLTTSPVQPMAEFGLFMAIGVAIGLGLAYTVLPSLLVWLPNPRLSQADAEMGFWYQYLHRLLRWVIASRKAILWASIVLVLLCGWGISRLQVNNRLLEDLKSDNPVRQAFGFYEERFSGARPFELELCLTDSTADLFALPILQQVDTIEGWLTAQYGVGFLISPLSYLKGLERARSGGNPLAYTLPETDRELRRSLRLLRQGGERSGWEKWFATERGCMRISGKMADQGSIDIRAKDEKFAQFMADFPAFSYQITGTAVLVDRNNQLVADNILLGLTLAFAVIAILAGVIFRSFRMVLITLIPNILPLMIVGAYMGFAGISIKLSTSIVFTIAFGIAVDDTIHFLTRFHTEAKRMHWVWALRRAFLSTGKAIVITTLILSGGFLALTFSDFMGTFLIGLLVSMTLFSALIADLILLPVLLLLFYRDNVPVQPNIENKQNGKVESKGPLD